MLVTSIFSFPAMFSTLSKTEIIIYVTFILSSANAFNLDKVKFLSSGNGLSIFSFPAMFSTLSKTEIIIYVTCILSSANAFNLDKVKFLLSGNGLRNIYLPAFSPFPTMSSTLSETEIIIYVTFILSSASAFDLDKIKFLSSRNGLRHIYFTPIEKQVRIYQPFPRTFFVYFSRM